jgi:hypothetical protein
MADPTAKSPGEEKGPQLDTTQDHNMNIILKDPVRVFALSCFVLKISHCPKPAVRYVLAESSVGTPTKYGIAGTW